MFTPQNEQGVIVLFTQMAQNAGWEFVSIAAAYPDAVLRKDGEEWAVEFEFMASNFLDHKHDHRQCDMIVCWENDYPDCPFPIIVLSNTFWVHAKYQKSDVSAKEIEYWKRRALRAENHAKSATKKIKIAMNRHSATKQSLTETEESYCRRVAELVNKNTIRTWDDLAKIASWSTKTSQRYGKLAKDEGFITKSESGLYSPNGRH